MLSSSNDNLFDILHTDKPLIVLFLVKEKAKPQHQKEQCKVQVKANSSLLRNCDIVSIHPLMRPQLQLRPSSLTMLYVQLFKLNYEKNVNVKMLKLLKTSRKL